MALMLVYRAMVLYINDYVWKQVKEINLKTLDMPSANSSTSDEQENKDRLLGLVAGTCYPRTFFPSWFSQINKYICVTQILVSL